MKRYFAIGLGLWAASTFYGQAADSGIFSRDIKPILELHCLKCHDAEHHRGGLRLDTLAATLKGGDNGTALVPGKPEMSKLYTSTTLAPDADDVMPPKKELKLTKAQTESLRTWIAQGAAWPEGVTL